MAVIASPDGTMSNQILPPIPQGEDPAAPLCYAPTSRPDLSLITGDQYATVDLTMRGGTPTTPGQNGSNIPAGWAAGATMDSLAGTAVATQQLHTCYGNAVPGVVTIITAGSELDQLYVRNDDQYLYIAVPGNLEGNGNRCNIFIDSIPMVGENTLDSQGLDDGFNSLFRWNGRKFDAAFAPDFAYVVNNSGGRLYADYYNLATDIKTYLGSSQVDSATGTLDGSGTNPNSDQFALDNSNGLGVVGFPTTLPVDPTTATLGLECKIALTELSVTRAATSRSSSCSATRTANTSRTSSCRRWRRTPGTSITTRSTSSTSARRTQWWAATPVSPAISSCWSSCASSASSITTRTAA